MRGLEQFFGMGIADKAQNAETKAKNDPGVIGSVKAKFGMGEKAEPNLGGFPTTPVAVQSPPKDAKPEVKDDAHKPDAKPNGPRDWSKMLGRVRADVERICDFLEALAKHPRGLQKYHEEAVRTVHDSWIDREGEQSLRRWVRSECSRIWPHKFAAIDVEKERARADVEGARGALRLRRRAPPRPRRRRPRPRARLRDSTRAGSPKRCSLRAPRPLEPAAARFTFDK